MTINRPSSRPSGYYWVIFPYPNGDRRWEPGSYDANAKMWALVGSGDPWFEIQLEAVGPPILGKPIDVPTPPRPV